MRKLPYACLPKHDSIKFFELVSTSSFPFIWDGICFRGVFYSDQNPFIRDELTFSVSRQIRYEPSRAQHAWDSPWIYTSLAFFGSPLHVGHHMRPTAPYYTLRWCPEAVQLPLPYPLLALLAFFPPAFFWVMNPRAAAAAE